MFTFSKGPFPWNPILTVDTFGVAALLQPLGADDDLTLDQKIWEKLDTEVLVVFFNAIHQNTHYGDKRTNSSYVS